MKKRKMAFRFCSCKEVAGKAYSEKIMNLLTFTFHSILQYLVEKNIVGDGIFFKKLLHLDEYMST